MTQKIESVSLSELLLEGTKLTEETRFYLIVPKGKFFANSLGYRFGYDTNEFALDIRDHIKIIKARPFFYKDGKVHIIFEVNKYSRKRGFYDSIRLKSARTSSNGYDIGKILRSWEKISSILYDHESKLFNSNLIKAYLNSCGVDRWIIKLLAINSPTAGADPTFIKHLKDVLDCREGAYFKKETLFGKSVVFDDIKNLRDFSAKIGFKILATDIIDNLEYTE